MEAMLSGDLGRAANTLLANCDAFDADELFQSAVLCAPIGNDQIFQIIEERLPDPELKLDEFKMGISALIQYLYHHRDEEQHGLKILEPLVQTRLNSDTMPVEEKAYLLNQIHRLKYSAQDYEGALEDIEQCLEWSPNKPPYLYNAALVCDKLRLDKKELGYVDQYMEVTKEQGVEDDDDILLHAVQCYAKSKRRSEMIDALECLKACSPTKSLLAYAISEVQELLGDSDDPMIAILAGSQSKLGSKKTNSSQPTK